MKRILTIAACSLYVAVLCGMTDDVRGRYFTLKSWPEEQDPNVIRVPTANPDDVTYEELSRSPQSYATSKIYLKGRVVQSLDSGGEGIVQIIVNVTPSRDFRRWSDTVFVEYHRIAGVGDQYRVIEGDIIIISGEFVGIKSYTTVRGATAQVPFVRIESVFIDTDMTRRLKEAR
jgi:hypothetical protein